MAHDDFNPLLKILALQVVKSYKEQGLDLVPTQGNMTMDYLYNEIEQETQLGRHYLDVIKNSVLDELQRRGFYQPDVISILTNEQGIAAKNKAVEDAIAGLDETNLDLTKKIFE